MAMEDYFFRSPISVPFKWEIRPGVPKPHHHHHHPQQPPSNHHHNHSFLHQEQHSTHHNNSSSPQKLTPPPAGYTFQPHSEIRTRSVLAVPRTRSGRKNLFMLAQPEVVSTDCFTRQIDKKNKKKKRVPKVTIESELQTDYTSDLEILSRWSVSTRKSLSPFRDSSSSSPFSSSYQSSPRPVSDAEWAGFGLF